MMKNRGRVRRIESERKEQKLWEREGRERGLKR